MDGCRWNAGEPRGRPPAGEGLGLDVTLDLEREAHRRIQLLIARLDVDDPYRAILEHHLGKVEDAVTHLELLTAGALRWLVGPSSPGLDHVQPYREPGPWPGRN